MSGTKRTHESGSTNIIERLKRAKHDDSKLLKLFESIMEKNDLEEFLECVETFVDENLMCQMLKYEPDTLDKFLEFSEKHGDELMNSLLEKFSTFIRGCGCRMMLDGQNPDPSISDEVVDWSDIEETEDERNIFILFHMAINHKKTEEFDLIDEMGHEAALLFKKLYSRINYDSIFTTHERRPWDWKDESADAQKMLNLKSVTEVVEKASEIYKLVRDEGILVGRALWFHYFKQFKDSILNYSPQESNEEMCTFLNIMQVLQSNRYVENKESMVVNETFPYFLEISKFQITSNIRIPQLILK